MSGAQPEPLPFFGAPPPRVARRAEDVPTLKGKRLILSLPEGFVYDMRAASEEYTIDGRAVVDVVTEEDYFRWMFQHSPPPTQSYPLRYVWVE